MEGLLQQIVDAINCLGTKFVCVGRAIAKFLIDLVLWGPRYIYAETCGYFEAFFNGLHFTDAFFVLMDMFLALEPYIGYFWNLLQMDSVLLGIFGATLLRFVLRHLPVVGG